MADIPKGAKRPQDHKSKAVSVSEQVKGRRFTLEHGGESFESKPIGDVLTPGFMRHNRRRDDLDAFYTILEALFDDDVLTRTVDVMSNEEFGDLSERFYEFIEATPGESTAS